MKWAVGFRKNGVSCRAFRRATSLLACEALANGAFRTYFAGMSVTVSRRFPVASLVLSAVLGSLSLSAAGVPAVATATQPVTNIYHGIAIVDDYQWLEDASAPTVRDWARSQNER